MIRFLSRLIIGLLFIFSGFVKAVDPVGGAIKLKDYFEAFGMDFLNGTALTLAVILSSIELIVGFHILVKIRIKQMAAARSSRMVKKLVNWRISERSHLPRSETSKLFGPTSRRRSSTSLSVKPSPRLPRTVKTSGGFNC